MPLPLGPIRPTRVPGVIDEVEVADEPPAAERLGDAARDEQLARPALRRGEVDPRAWPRALRARLSASSSISRSASSMRALGLGRARLGAAAQPLDLAPHRVGQRLLVGRLPAQELVAARQELAVASLRLEEAVGVRAVQLEHARGHVLQEVAVVADHEAGARAARPAALQPEDAVDVEVIGRLVHQEEVGRGRQLARDRQALAPAARQRVDRRAAVGEPGPAERLGAGAGPVVFVHAGQRREHARRRPCRPAGTPDPAARSPRGRRRGASGCRGRASRDRRGS